MSVTKKIINKKSVPSKCSVVEYPFNGNDMDIGIFYIKDEYPLTGFCVNKITKLLMYVLKGDGTIQIGEHFIDVGEGVALVIPPNHKYRFTGNFECVISSTPAWDIDQFELIDE